MRSLRKTGASCASAGRLSSATDSPTGSLDSDFTNGEPTAGHSPLAMLVGSLPVKAR
jgi:hypothetical protein